MQWISDNWVLVGLIGGFLVYLAMRRGGGLFGGHGHGSRRSSGHSHGHGSHNNQHDHDGDDEQGKKRGKDQAAAKDPSDPSVQDAENTRDKRD